MVEEIILARATKLSKAGLGMKGASEPAGEDSGPATGGVTWQPLGKWGALAFPLLGICRTDSGHGLQEHGFQKAHHHTVTAPTGDHLSGHQQVKRQLLCDTITKKKYQQEKQMACPRPTHIPMERDPNSNAQLKAGCRGARL